jgi:ferrous iron transport protein B
MSKTTNSGSEWSKKGLKLFNFCINNVIGNPNSGKSSVFNHLTGLNQKVGNFPGVTVDKKTGYTRLPDGRRVRVLDLPGTYSLYPRSLDERVVFDVLIDTLNEDYPDVVVVVADAANLKRNLLLFTQIKDLGIPVILALNMLDVSTNLGQKVRPIQIAKHLDVPVISINGRTGEGIELLKKALSEGFDVSKQPVCDISSFSPEVIKAVQEKYQIENPYRAYLYAQQWRFLKHIPALERLEIEKTAKEHLFQNEFYQSKETINRYKYIDKILEEAVEYNVQESRNLTRKLDKLFTHRIFGYVIFLFILFLIFQAIFSWASTPMDFIDWSFSELASFLHDRLPSNKLVDLLTEGIIPGIAGVLIFIPQIAILFAFIALLEETGYMARVVFLMDKFMRRFGLNGKSVVPLISGVACAIPAIMSTRTIDNWKERISTILVIPLMSCSARLPVYTILIALVVPKHYVFGFLNLQGLVLMGMYLLGFLMAIVSAVVINKILQTREKSYFIMEMPLYKFPRWKNVGLTIVEKSKTFAFEAGKVILAISIILWALASYGPEERMQAAAQYVNDNYDISELSDNEIQDKIQAYKLENSYAGILGKSIEPVIEPLGYDWKMGIALITSFAAREVFVGTMATIYSIGSVDLEDEATIKNRMKAEKDPKTGERKYTLPVAISLLLFYAFAMQCMSTLAITWRETKSWKWPMIQLVYMSVLAYVSALLAYQVLS